MLHHAFNQSFTLVRQCLVPMLLLSAAAQASAVEITPDTITFALCRSEAGAVKYTKKKDGTWTAMTNTGAGSKVTFSPGNTFAFNFIYASGKATEINLDARTCEVRPVTGQVTDYALEVSAAL